MPGSNNKALQKPNKPNKSQKQNSKPSGYKKGGQGGGGGNSGGSGGNDNKRPNPPSPWLDPENEPTPHRNASFVEYLRWMRSPEDKDKDPTKVQILHLATENADYRDRLSQLNKRLQLMAGQGNTFIVECPWRIRVGGHKGPENILLPAFDALGIPYIPSSTLRGVARTQAILEVLQKDPDWEKVKNHKDKDKAKAKWQAAEAKIAPYFGSLEAEKGNKAGKVVFFDAYPRPSASGGLTPDMANNIWSWDGDKLKYSPNPNIFLSLQKTEFLIGLKLASGCEDKQVLANVREWLIKGLTAGIGSQINTGYGELLTAKNKTILNEFFRVEFALEGQLIHGRQKFTQWQWNDRRYQWQMRGQPEAEVRPVAFKSMLRYWFRTFALGVLKPSEVQDLEGQIFGAITPKPQLGWLKVSVLDGKVTQPEPFPNHRGKNDPCGEQEGTLVLSLSAQTPQAKQEAIKTLCKTLTWLMFNMGGIGQGARRPCYSRQNRDRAPWFRGSTFYLENVDDFWKVSSTVQGFTKQFQQKIATVYQSINQLTSTQINPKSRREAGRVTAENWTEAIDCNCEIIICSGREKNDKVYALSILHSPNLKTQNASGRTDYDGNLCGKVSRGVKPSPVWISDLGDYQVVTVFGANQNPRKRYLQELKSNTGKQNYTRVFPL